MADPTTVNRSLAIPSHGSDVDTWDQPLNTNFGALDTIVGGVSSISTTGGTTTLNAAQLACGTISVSGTLASNAVIAFPAVQGWWAIENLTVGGVSSFVVRVQAGTATEFIAAPPGEITYIQVNANAVKFVNLGRVGTYIDYAVTSVPTWISNCTIPPYLNCDGTAFSGATYPRLQSILGGTTLPDMRGTVRATMNQGTNRLTVINGNALFSQGGDQFLQSHAHAVSASGTTAGDSPDHTHNVPQAFLGGNPGLGSGSFQLGNGIVASAGANNPHFHAWSFNVSSAGAGSGGSQNLQPTTVGGITLIRAA